MNIPFWRSGADLPLAVRIKRAAFAMTMLIVVTLGSVLLTLALIEIPANQIETNQNAVDVIGEVLSGDIRNQLGNLRHLSRSSLVWTALTDSAGREAYLKPFLQNREKDAALMQMQLLDYRGRRVLGDLPAFVATGQSAPLITKVLKQRQPKLALVAKDGRSALLAIFPVPFPYTQETIGALAGVIDLSSLLQKRSAGLGQKLGVDLMHQGRAVDVQPRLVSSRFFPVQFDLALGENTEGGALALRLYSTENPWLQPVFERILLSALIAALLGVLLWQISGVIARQLTQRFDRLANACVAISEGRAATIPDDAANDEIGVLSRTLRQAVNAYEQVNVRLEKLVEERTRELAQSELKFRLLAEKSVVGIYVIQDARMVYVNPSLAKTFGYAPEEIIGKLGLEELIHPDDIELVRTRFKERLQGKIESGSAIYKGIKKDGTPIHIETYGSLIDYQGSPAVMGSLQDITERKQAEAARAQLAAIVQSSHDAIIGKDLDGVITSWNPGAEKVYGYRAEEVVGKPVSILAPEGRKEEVTGLLERVRRGEAVMNFETERYRGDGRRIDISLDMSPIRDASARITGASTIARDVTEKKQADRVLRKLNRALKALSGCNEALIHANDEMQLLDKICRLIIDIEGYRMAWVGYVERDAQMTVRPVAQAGYEPGYVEHAQINWADSERGPLGIAIRSGKIQVVQNVNTDPRFEPWRADAAKLGYGSVLFAPLLSNSEVIGALSIYADSVDAFDQAEITLLGELAADMAFGIVTLRTRGAQEQSAVRLQRSMEATIQAIAGTVEMRDPYTAGHQRRVAELATAIAQELGLTPDQVRGVHLAGVVHDLGKIHIPAEILSKPGKLTRIEFELIKAHPEAGYEILKGVDFPWPIAQIVLQHHERLDGSGYPRGLKADEILPAARIIAVADVVEAMSSHRPYRPSLGIEPALQEISANAGKYYDADAARVCIALFREQEFAFKG